MEGEKRAYNNFKNILIIALIHQMFNSAMMGVSVAPPECFATEIRSLLDVWNSLHCDLNRAIHEVSRSVCQ